MQKTSTLPTIETTKLYQLLTPVGIILSKEPGRFAGWKSGKIFGTLECESGKRMLSANRVFFRSIKDALACGYRPCKKCRPYSEAHFICSDCGSEFLTEKQKKDKTRVFTFREGRCFICSEVKDITSVRHYNYLRKP